MHLCHFCAIIEQFRPLLTLSSDNEQSGLNGRSQLYTDFSYFCLFSTVFVRFRVQFDTRLYRPELVKTERN